MRVKQHLVGLQQIGPDDESAAVAQLEVRHLQLDALAAEDRPVLAPVELERFAGLKSQGDKCSPPAGLLFALTVRFPVADEGGHAAIGVVKSHRDQIRMQLFGRPLLLAGFGRLNLQPAQQLVGEGVQLARPVRNFQPWLNCP